MLLQLPAIAALAGMMAPALLGQAVPPGCERAARVAVNGVALGSSYFAARAKLPPAPGEKPSQPVEDTTRIRYVGRGVYLGVSADTIVSIGLEAPSTLEICGVHVGQSRPEVARRWGRPRSELPSAWLYSDSVMRPPRWVSVVYFTNPLGRLGEPGDSVARIAVMLGPGTP